MLPAGFTLLKGELWMKEKIKDIEKKRVAEMVDKFSKLHGRST